MNFMNFLVTLICIGIVVMFYLHVVFQLKTSNDLEIYEIELPDKIGLEEVCNLRQPIVFNHTNDSIQKCTPSHLLDYKAFDITVLDNSHSKVPLKLEKAFQLFETNEKYYTSSNDDFLNETMAKRMYENLDYSLRPPMVTTIKYDLLFGSEGATTRFQYSNYYRNYFYVTEGTVHVKLAPPKNKNYLHAIQSYDQQEYYSPVDPWNVQEAYKYEFEKVKCLELTLKKGQMLFIPAYWWYSIQLNKDACVCTLQYRTVMNIVSILPDICLGWIQKNNTKTKMKEFNLPTPRAPAPTSPEPASHT